MSNPNGLLSQKLCHYLAGLRKTRFFSEKNNPPVFFALFETTRFFCFFKKKQDFVLSLRKMEKPYS